MANFPSGGAAEAFIRGRQVRQNKAAIRQQQQDATRTRVVGFRDHLAQSRQGALDVFNSVIGDVQKLAEAGATDAQLQPSIAAAKTALAAFAQDALAFQEMAAGSGAGEDLLMAMPDGLSFVRQHLPRIESAIQSGRLMHKTAARKGTEAADERMAEVARIAETLGKPVDEVAAAMGVVPAQKAPDVVNFQLPNGDLTAIDKNAPDAVERVRDLTRQGAVRVGLSVQADTPAALSVSATEIKDFRSLEASSRIAVNEIGRLRQQLGDQSVKTGLVAGAVRGLDTLADQFIQAAAALGLDEGNVLDSAAYDLSGFGDEAQSSAALRSNVINLAYLMAKAAEPGGRLSTPDVQNQIDRLSAGGGRMQFGAALSEIERGIKDAFRIQHEIFARSAEVGPVPAELRITDPLAALVEKGEANLTADDLKTLTDAELLELRRRLR